MQMPYLTGHADVRDAADLLARFGEDAGIEAAARADASRNIGNHLHFCRWRQIERLILVLAQERPLGTRH